MSQTLSYVKPIYELCQRLRDQGNRHSGLAQDDLDFLTFLLKHAHLSASQIFQDLWVLFETGAKRAGYFVEFGACDGRRLSNTLILEKLYDWTGVLSEPCRTWHHDLFVNRACAITTKAVYSQSGRTVPFKEPAIREHATIAEFADSDGHAHTRKEGDVYEVETISLMDLLASARAPRVIDYMSLDTEGSELSILQSFDFGAYDVRLISVEHNHTPRRAEIFDLLTAQGYRRKFYKLSQFDDWYVRA